MIVLHLTGTLGCTCCGVARPSIAALRAHTAGFWTDDHGLHRRADGKTVGLVPGRPDLVLIACKPKAS